MFILSIVYWSICIIFVQNYSQIDKEATGTYWGVKKLFPYCYGRDFFLITDHNPLVLIFHPSKCLPAMSATRFLNYVLFLAGFNHTIEYRSSSQRCNSDFLSRFSVDPSEIHEYIHISWHCYIFSTYVSVISWCKHISTASWSFKSGFVKYIFVNRCSPNQ